MKSAVVLWFTGLSGAGKSTIAQKVYEWLTTQGLSVKILDGDAVRSTLHRHLGYSPNDIKENNRLISQLCMDNLSEFDYILVPIISPFRESRQKAKELLGKNFIEVYVKASLNQLIERDPKGLYKKALSGKIKNFIGIDPTVPYEPPANASIVVNTIQENVDESVNQIKNFLSKEKFLLTPHETKF